MPARRPWFALVLLALLIGYGMLLWTKTGVYAGGADSAGYLGSARLLSEGRLRTSVRTLPGAPLGKVPITFYMPLGFRMVGPTELAPTYPVGLPLLIAAAAPIPDREARAAVVLVLHAVAGVLLTFLLALECGLPRYMAALAALLVASSPAYLFVSVTLMSDMPALVWTTAAVLAMLKSVRDSRWALLSGAAISVAVLIRPTNALAFLPLLVCAGRSPRRWLLLAAGGLPGAVWFVVYNLGAYGGALASGYGNTDYLFGVDHVVPSLRHYALWLPVVLTPIVLLALGLPAIVRQAPLQATVLMLWSLVFPVFYLFYSYTYQTWWYTRFLLPAFPPLAVGSLMVARSAIARLKRGAAWQRFAAAGPRLPAAISAALVGAAILVHNVAWAQRLDAFAPGRGEARYRAAADWARSNLPPGSGIVAMQGSGAFFYYTDFPVLRWDQIDGDALRSLEPDAKAGRHPLFAVLLPFDFEAGVRDKLQGRWVQEAAVGDVTIWRFDGLAEGVGSIPADERWLAARQK
jgi:hypothetical protein